MYRLLKLLCRTIFLHKKACGTYGLLVFFRVPQKMYLSATVRTVSL